LGDYGPFADHEPNANGGAVTLIECGAVSFDAIKHLALCCIERRPPRLNLTVYPYLPKAVVATTSARSYMDLLTGLAA